LNRSRDDNASAAAVFRWIGNRPGPVVIIAPHPDDETLGAGRLILALGRAGIRPAFVLLTDGTGSHPQSAKWPSRRLGRLRQQELRRALGRLGLGRPDVRSMHWRDGHLASDGRVLRLRAVLNSLHARTVLVTSPLDHHPDHKAAFALASAAADRTKMALWTYAVWTRTAQPRRKVFGPGRAQQYWAMKAHRSQLGSYIGDDPSGFSFSPETLSAILDTGERYGLEPHRAGPNAP
jgi:LmbE family N-acetylglucosaminyl deacetylase